MSEELWEPTGAGAHRRLSRRPAALALLDDAVRDDPAMSELLDGVREDPQRWGGTGRHYAGVWRETGAAVLLKLGLTEDELHWTRLLAVRAPELVPVLFASGDRLGPPPGLAVRWAVQERIATGLHPGWRGEEFTMLLEAGVRFQRVARRLPSGHARLVDQDTVRGWLARGLVAAPPGPAGRLFERFAEDWAWLVAICPPELCHGDLHMSNALCRNRAPLPGKALLIDPAPAVQPWAFDAAWAQVLNSIDRRRPGYLELIPRMAALREAHGLDACSGPELARLAAVTLGWFAVRAWDLTSSRRTIPDYVHETRRYIEEGVAAASRS